MCIVKIPSVHQSKFHQSVLELNLPNLENSLYLKKKFLLINGTSWIMSCWNRVYQKCWQRLLGSTWEAECRNKSLCQVVNYFCDLVLVTSTHDLLCPILCAFVLFCCLFLHLPIDHASHIISSLHWQMFPGPGISFSFHYGWEFFFPWWIILYSYLQGLGAYS